MTSEPTPRELVEADSKALFGNRHMVLALDGLPEDGYVKSIHAFAQKIGVADAVVRPILTRLVDLAVLRRVDGGSRSTEFIVDDSGLLTVVKQPTGYIISRAGAAEAEARTRLWAAVEALAEPVRFRTARAMLGPSDEELPIKELAERLAGALDLDAKQLVELAHGSPVVTPGSPKGPFG